MTKLEKEILGRCQTQRAYDFMLYVIQNKRGYSTAKYFELTGVTPRQQGGLRYSFGYTYGAEFKKLKSEVLKEQTTTSDLIRGILLSYLDRSCRES